MRSTVQDVIRRFTEMHRAKPIVVRSPGRINLIGEHTDYNGGFVMPAAINYDTVFAVSPADDGVSEVYSVMYQQSFLVDLDNPLPQKEVKWVNYLLGVLKQFQMKGNALKPFKCVFGGDVPLGAGLSSSASVECGFAYAMNQLNGHDIPRMELIHMAQWAEHHYAGVMCGIMDQFASMMGKKNNVIVLDCRSLEYHYSPLQLPDHKIVLCDTRVKHALVDSEYNSRRSECEGGVAILKKYYPQVNSLRDATEQMLEQHREEMPGKMYPRCLYVVQEIKRVQEASEDLKANRLTEFGMKMFETHAGLSQMYEVSCTELDFLVDEAIRFGSVTGARMMGGGFGGCTINLVPSGDVDRFVKTVSSAYRNRFNHDMAYYVVSVEDGTSEIDVLN